MTGHRIDLTAPAGRQPSHIPRPPEILLHIRLIRQRGFARRNQDISKGLVALICNIAFIIVYLLTLFILGGIMGLPAEIPSIPGLVLYIVEKLFLSVPMSLLMIAINLVFRRNYGWSIVFICIAATGVITMSLQMGLQMLGLGSLAHLLNFTITGASNFATTIPNLVSLFIIVIVSVVWTLLCSAAGNALMNQRDIL